MERNSTDRFNLPSRRSKEWSTQGIRGYVMLFVEFLRLSPSYSLANDYSTGLLTIEQTHKRLIDYYQAESSKIITSEQKIQLISDFQDVLKTYEEFGDLTTVDFETWWTQRGSELFGYDHARPKVTQISQINKGLQDSVAIVESLKRHFETQYLDQGSPPTLLLSIPLGVPKRTLLAQVSKMIDASGIATIPKSQKAKRPFSAKRLRSKPLFCYLTLLMAKAISPQAKLWQMGIKAKVSPTHSQGLTINSKNTSQTIDQRKVLAILTSRAMRKAKLTAENAARGQFPSFSDRPLVHFDWDEMYSRMRLHRPTLKPRTKSK